MPHEHTHIETYLSDRRLFVAIGLNLLLTLVEAIAGLLAGSLALLADALHNFNDCGSLVIALVARRVARRPSDVRRTFGYRRAEVVGALINLTILVVVGLYLAGEGIHRLFAPADVDGWIVVVVAAIALAVDLGTAMLLFVMSRGNLNVRAAYLHNLSDAIASVGVIVAGVAVLLWNARWVDPLVTLVIAAYILWQSLSMMTRAVHILMEGAPADVHNETLVGELEKIAGVIEVHHVHIWELDEHHRALEAHIVVDNDHLQRWAEIKQEIKRHLGERFDVHHSTLEFEAPGEEACQPCPPGTHHHC
ncbi:MAG TPA: cation diffusion facilitator family transporter [Lacipirellulaceae bacterium]|nr:cation diffusion facilitator family transporter [Lacipirellulaceae bacterium]